MSFLTGRTEDGTWIFTEGMRHTEKTFMCEDQRVQLFAETYENNTPGEPHTVDLLVDFAVFTPDEVEAKHARQIYNDAFAPFYEQPATAENLRACEVALLLAAQAFE